MKTMTLHLVPRPHPSPESHVCTCHGCQVVGQVCFPPHRTFRSISEIPSRYEDRVTKGTDQRTVLCNSRSYRHKWKKPPQNQSDSSSDTSPKSPERGQDHNHAKNERRRTVLAEYEICNGSLGSKRRSHESQASNSHRKISPRRSSGTIEP